MNVVNSEKKMIWIKERNKQTKKNKERKKVKGIEGKKEGKKMKDRIMK